MTVYRQPRRSSSGLPPVAAIGTRLDAPSKDGWLAALDNRVDGECRLRIDAPSGLALVHEMQIEVSPAWVTAARESGAVSVYVGTFHQDLYENPDALMQMVAAGRIAGGRVPVRFAA